MFLSCIGDCYSKLLLRKTPPDVRVTSLQLIKFVPAEIIYILSQTSVSLFEASSKKFNSGNTKCQNKFEVI